ncbi:ADP-ribosylation factor-like protein 4C isoform X1 [Acanthopagrus latus]|uniref:ADP-ribosylation factor-like protein 4C isoform X1 n=1 Tax=Acanthopagrus latus TaxID=8177 RepID=UPI00187BD567|nr:ADP-ribosylation factor-like protein 4C isoform X1 [Acanthopagrus latus]
MGNSFSNISAFQSLHIVMLGLDSAGKTTVLYRLKFNEFVNTVPTIGFNTEKIKLSNSTAKGISCHFWDVGGQEKLRPLWKSYSRCTDGIIYVVDSVDVDRLEEAKTELHKVTKFAENQGTPLLVIANKQDLPKSLPVADIEKQLALHDLTPSITYHIQPACAIIGSRVLEPIPILTLRDEQLFTLTLTFCLCLDCASWSIQRASIQAHAPTSSQTQDLLAVGQQR